MAGRREPHVEAAVRPAASPRRRRSVTKRARLPSARTAALRSASTSGMSSPRRPSSRSVVRASPVTAAASGPLPQTSPTAKANRPPAAVPARVQREHVVEVAADLVAPARTPRRRRPRRRRAAPAARAAAGCAAGPGWPRSAPRRAARCPARAPPAVPGRRAGAARGWSRTGRRPASRACGRARPAAATCPPAAAIAAAPAVSSFGRAWEPARRAAGRRLRGRHGVEVRRAGRPAAPRPRARRSPACSRPDSSTRCTADHGPSRGVASWATRASAISGSRVPASRSPASARKPSQPCRRRSISVTRALCTARATASTARCRVAPASLPKADGWCDVTPTDPIERPSASTGTATSERTPGRAQPALGAGPEVRVGVVGVAEVLVHHRHQVAGDPGRDAVRRAVGHQPARRRQPDERPGLERVVVAGHQHGVGPVAAERLARPRRRPLQQVAELEPDQ